MGHLYDRRSMFGGSKPRRVPLPVDEQTFIAVELGRNDLITVRLRNVELVGFESRPAVPTLPPFPVAASHPGEVEVTDGVRGRELPRGVATAPAVAPTARDPTCGS